ncbi:MAG: M15 family metallopeptidase [Lachnospiraceae bacterium]|nr:M15 family metallopeptidase [Lachnospiraceae bacterium]
MKQFDWRNIVKPLIGLLLIITGCAITARFLKGQETLADYARKNPELAYKTDAEKGLVATPDLEGVYEQKTLEKEEPGVKPSLPELPEIPPAGSDPAQASGVGDGEAAEGAGQTGQQTAGADSSADQAAGSDAAARQTADSGKTADQNTAAQQTAAADGSQSTDNAAAGASGSQSAADAASGASGAQGTDNAATGASGDASTGGTDSSASASTGDTAEHPDRTIYKEGFYMEPIDEDLKKRITGVSYPEDCPVSLDVLRHLGVKYIDFYDTEQEGELICNERIAQDLLEIFYSLYTQRYPIESIRLVDDYGGDDTRSMVANNTSCFNYRTVEGSNNLSRHALGLAIDVNPLYNPWINFNGDGTYTVSPDVSEEYADRTADFAHKIDENDLCYQEFSKHNFFWGGHWNNPDYQHFQKN